MRFFATLTLAAPVVLVSASAWLHGCSSETVTLLDVKVNDGGEPAGPRVCATSDDCSNGFFCDLPSCGAASGTCEQNPIGYCPDAGTDDSAEQPVCGCDKVTYWNDCLRARFGVSKASDAPCVPAPSDPPCGGGIAGAVACPTGLYCAQLGGSGHGMQGDPCAHPPGGSCWALPPKCPPSDPSSVFQWSACGSTSSTCIDTCHAILEGGTYRGAGKCE